MIGALVATTKIPSFLDFGFAWERAALHLYAFELPLIDAELRHLAYLTSVSYSPGLLVH